MMGFLFQVIIALVIWSTNPTWDSIVVYGGSLLLGIITNFCIAAFYAGKYKERVERLTKEVNRFEEKVDAQASKIEEQEKDFLKQQITVYKELASYGKMIAAITGKANGVDFREEH